MCDHIGINFLDEEKFYDWMSSSLLARRTRQRGVQSAISQPVVRCHVINQVAPCTLQNNIAFVVYFSCWIKAALLFQLFKFLESAWTIYPVTGNGLYQLSKTFIKTFHGHRLWTFLCALVPKVPTPFIVAPNANTSRPCPTLDYVPCSWDYLGRYQASVLFG